MADRLAPGISASDQVILFDDVCCLCNAWIRFLIRYDRKRRFKLASVQSAEGKAILAWYGFPTDAFETMLLVEGPQLYMKSAAFVRVMARLPWPWKIASVVWIIPRFLRDWLYDRIALNRYALFGRFESCSLPSADHQARFISGPNSLHSSTLRRTDDCRII
jgi:predicted DCC family thiol-disulfide oxidoreductase YuxK